MTYSLEDKSNAFFFLNKFTSMVNNEATIEERRLYINPLIAQSSPAELSELNIGNIFNVAILCFLSGKEEFDLSKIQLPSAHKVKLLDYYRTARREALPIFDQDDRPEIILSKRANRIFEYLVCSSNFFPKSTVKTILEFAQICFEENKTKLDFKLLCSMHNRKAAEFYQTAREFYHLPKSDLTKNEISLINGIIIKVGATILKNEIIGAFEIFDSIHEKVEGKNLTPKVEALMSATRTAFRRDPNALGDLLPNLDYEFGRILREVKPTSIAHPISTMEQRPEQPEAGKTSAMTTTDLTLNEISSIINLIMEVGNTLVAGNTDGAYQKFGVIRNQLKDKNLNPKFLGLMGDIEVAFKYDILSLRELLPSLGSELSRMGSEVKPTSIGYPTSLTIKRGPENPDSPKHTKEAWQTSSITTTDLTLYEISLIIDLLTVTGNQLQDGCNTDAYTVFEEIRNKLDGKNLTPTILSLMEDIEVAFTFEIRALNKLLPTLGRKIADLMYSSH